MTMMAKVLIVLPVILITVLSAEIANAQSMGFSLSGDEGSQLTVNVIDDMTQTPIAGAEIKITNSLDQLAATGGTSTTLASNSQGVAIFSNLYPLPRVVTVTHTGYATVSVVGAQGSSMTAYLKPVIANGPNAQELVASGTITEPNWGPLGSDEHHLHLGLVLRTLSALDLLHFQESCLVSPLRDTINLGGILGSHGIPSNVILPPQTVEYLFVSVKLDKPNYRFPFSAGEKIRMIGAEAETPVSSIVGDAISGNFSVDLLNQSRFKRLGFTDEFSSNENVQLNIVADQMLSPQRQVTLSALPPFTSDVLAANLMDLNGDKEVLVPTDVKKFDITTPSDDPNDPNNNNDDNPEPTPLPDAITLSGPGTPTSSHQLVTAIALGNMGSLVSGIVSNSTDKNVQMGEFLNTPALDQNEPLPETVAIQAPAQGIATTVLQTDQPVWYIYAMPSAGAVSVPVNKLASGMGIKIYSVSQMEFSHFDEKALDGTKIMSLLQRFANSSAIIKN